MDQHENKKIMELVDDRSDPKWAHPDLQSFWQPGGLFDLTDPILEPGLSAADRQALRSRIDDMFNEMSPPDPELDALVEKTEYWAPGCEEEPDAPPVRTVVVTPKDRNVGEVFPVVFLIYGGGLTSGSPEMMMPQIKATCRDQRAVVVCGQYRLAPDSKYPAAINDLHAAYKFVVENAEQLGVDPDRVVVTGSSSGGHLSLALAFRLKRFGYKPRGVVALMPMLDDRAISVSSRIRGDFAWDAVREHQGWLAWLGPENVASAFIGPEAVPGHATVEDCKGLAPIFVHAMESDPGADDALRFVSLCRAAKVYTELHSWGGTNHLSLYVASGVPKADLYNSMVHANIKDALTNDLRREWL